MKQTVLYMRMSTDKQESSIESQREILIPFAKRNNMEIIHEYADSGISGRTAAKRPQFLQMIDDSADGAFDTVLIYDSSRFARNLKESLVYKSILRDNGVTLVSATEPTLDDEASLLLDAIQGAANELYSIRQSKQARRGGTHAAQQGRHQGRAPFGYCKHIGNPKLTVDEERAKVVKYVFDEYLKGASYWRIAKDLDAMGIRTERGYLFNTSFIKKMLQNVSYIGYTHYTPVKANKNEVIITKATHESIIDDDIFSQVQAKLESDKIGRVKHERPQETYSHWLVGIVKCKHCGANLMYNSGNAKRHPFFRCARYCQAICPVSNHVTASRLEGMLIGYLKDISEGVSIAKNIQVVQIQVIGSEKSVITENLRKLTVKKERAKQGYLNGIIELDESRIILADCDNQISELTKKLEAIESPKTDYVKLQKTLTTLCSTLLNPDFDKDEKQTAVKQVIQKVLIDRKSNLIEVFFYQ